MPDFPVRLYAHRGANLVYPENTIPAFAEALREGATHLEMDLHCTQDDAIIVAHDDDGMRMAGKPGRIAEITLGELKTWDAGANFPFENKSDRKATIPVPTFAEVLDEFPGVPVNIDIKQHESRVVRIVLDLIHKKHAADRVLLSSFNPEVIEEIQALGYDGETGVTRWNLLRLKFLPGPFHRWPRIRGDALQLPMRWNTWTFATRSLIDRCHNAGKRVDFWVINEIDKAVELLEMGADGIMTDDVARLRPAIEDYVRRSGRRLAPQFFS